MSCNQKWNNNRGILFLKDISRGKPQPPALQGLLLTLFPKAGRIRVRIFGAQFLGQLQTAKFTGYHWVIGEGCEAQTKQRCALCRVCGLKLWHLRLQDWPNATKRLPNTRQRIEFGSHIFQTTWAQRGSERWSETVFASASSGSCWFSTTSPTSRDATPSSLVW